MKVKIIVLLITFSSCINLVNSQEDTLRVYYKIEETPKFGDSFEPIIKAERINNKGSNAKIKLGDDDLFMLEFSENQLSATVTVDFEELPVHYDFIPLMFNFPITQIDKSNTVILSPIKIDKDYLGRDSRVLFSTNVNKLSLEDLFKFYQKSRAVAIIRINRLSNDWRKLHDFDVQCVYKYLEATMKLSKEAFLMPTKETDLAIAWLSDALNNKPARVKHALGKLEHANQIISGIENLEGLNFRKLWNVVTIRLMLIKDTFCSNLYMNFI